MQVSETGERGASRLASSVLILVFLFGAAAGLAAGYLLWGGAALPREPAPPEPVAALPSPPPAPEPVEPPPVEKEPEAGPLELLAEEIDVWPARHIFISAPGTSLDAAARLFLAELKPGGVVLLADNIKDEGQTARLVDQIKAAVGLGMGIDDLPLVAVDQEGGPVNRLGLKNAPSASELGKTRDLGVARKTGLNYAAECLARGISVVFAPALDVYEPGANRFMEKRCFGTDNQLVTAMGLAFADGLVEGGAIAVAKHFPGHGAAEQDSHRALAVLAKDTQGLAAVMFPFQEAATCAIPGIMVGHIAVPAFNDDEPKRPASVSPALVRGFLRERWAYDGVILTDDLAMEAVTGSRSAEDAAVEALAAGCDALVFLDRDPQRIRSVCAAIDQAVKEGRVPRDQLLKSMRRLDAWQSLLRDGYSLKKPLPMLAAAIPDAQPTPEGAESLAATAPGETEATPARQPVRSEPAASRPAVPEPSEEEFELYRVEPGDTVHGLARRFGVSAQRILDLNHMKPSDTLFYGRKIRIPKTAVGPAPSEG